MLSIFKNEKIKCLFIFIIVLICMPLIEVLFNIVITLGRYVGTNIRLIEEGICLK